MSWTIAVPLKAAGARKSRLAPALDAVARERLAGAMLAHVLAVLTAVTDASVLIVAAARPEGWAGRWQADGGADLNAALAVAREVSGGRFAVVHADLPRLATSDVVALLDAATDIGVALAPDRHGTGTNAIAIGDDRPIDFVFGPGSCAGFVRQGALVVRRPGFALDVDTADDLALLLYDEAARLIDRDATHF